MVIGADGASDGSGPVTASDRAQMILIGSVVIAVIVVGLAIIVNGIIAPGTAEIDDRTRSLDDARAFDAQASDGIASLVLRLNHDHRNATATQLADNVTAHVRDYSHLLGESYTASRGLYANVTYDNGSSAFGHRLVQAGNASLSNGTASDPDSVADWTPVEGGEGATVGRFAMNVDVSETSDRPFAINVTNASGAWVNTTVNKTTAGESVALRIHTNVSYAGNATATCDSSSGRVLLDLLAGETLTGGCTFNGSGDLEPPHEVRIRNGDRGVARYEIVVNETIASPRYEPCHPNIGPLASTAVPCTAPAIWEANVTTRFVDDGVEFTNSRNVSVYGGDT